MSIATFDRVGEVSAFGQDYHGRPDAVTFTARADQALIDWLAEAYVWIDRWATREGIATLFESDGGDGWSECAVAIPFDALTVIRETQIQLVFSQYIRLQPGRRYLLFLPGSVVTKPEVRIVALQRSDRVEATRTRVLRRKAS